ncbi:hypothetical protein ACTXJE_11415 [Glutamicibacter ardleyensis]
MEPLKLISAKGGTTKIATATYLSCLKVDQGKQIHLDSAGGKLKSH